MCIRDRTNISSIKAVFADGVAGTITLSNNGRDLVYTAETLLLWAGGENGVWSCLLYTSRCV